MDIKFGERLDYIRVVAIILVVFQHAISMTITSQNTSSIVSLLFCMDISTFMIISGCLYEANISKYKTSGIVAFIKKKVRRLLIPYLAWESVLYFGVYLIMNAGLIPAFVKNLVNSMGFSQLTITEILASLITFEDSYVELYWFIYVLFLINVVTYVLDIFIKPSKAFFLLLFGMPLVLAYINAGYIMRKFAFSILLFYIGRIFSKRELLYDKISPYIALIVTVAFGLVYNFPEGAKTIYGFQLKYVTKLTVLGILGTIIVIFLTDRLLKIKCFSNLQIVGKYSFSIYLMHHPYILAICSIVMKKIGMNGYVAVVISTIIGIVAPILLDKYLLNKHCAFMLGKTSKMTQ